MQIAEDKLIERIRRRIPSSPGGPLRLGIGHDAAVIRPDKKDWVITCDQFLEDAHFIADKHPPESVGYKALARATSDVLAMGARPRLFLLSLALPVERTGTWLDRMLSGMARANRLLGLKLAGGDTARSSGKKARVALNITVLGETENRSVIGRAGAKPGDRVYVTGTLGRAQLGLELFLRRRLDRRKDAKLLAQHLYPALPLEVARWLGRTRFASAMMDISDGLSTDLSRLLRASGVGAQIFADRIPAVVIPPPLRRFIKSDALTFALHGGEDYGLLFTIPRRFESRIPKRFRGTRITCIGKVVRQPALQMIAADGRMSPVVPHGWDHFAAR